MNRLERYLVMVRDGGAQPWVLLTKTDLVEGGQARDERLRDLIDYALRR